MINRIDVNNWPKRCSMCYLRHSFGHILKTELEDITEMSQEMAKKLITKIAIH